VDRQELLELTISWLTISIAFAWDMDPYSFTHNLPFYLVAVGTAFIFHELAHRYVAHRFGYPARYIMWKEGLFFALLLSILTNGRFVFAAPGAVYIFGHPRPRENAYISAAGPTANLLVALFTCAFLFLASPVKGMAIFLQGLAWVNLFIGVFNLLPIYPLDGSKVLPYEPFLYVVLLILFGLGFFLCGF
jgi:Zn-dependent protease